MPNEPSIYADLVTIESQVSVDKSAVNKFGKYNYRTITDINRAIKKVANKLGDGIRYTEEDSEDGRRKTVTCHLFNSKGEEVTASVTVDIDRTKRGMSPEQMCGSATTYGQKYAAGALFAIADGEEDPDAHKPEPKPKQTEAKKALFDAVRDYLKLQKEPYANKDIAAVVKGLDGYAQADDAWFKKYADAYTQATQELLEAMK